MSPSFLSSFFRPSQKRQGVSSAPQIDSLTGRTEIFRTEFVRAVSRPNGLKSSAATFVTFTPRSDQNTLDKDGFGETFLFSRGLNAVHVISKEDHWYQHPEMSDLVSMVRNHIPAAVPVITYGSSMGGYAALRFADELKAKCAILVSPQFSLADPIGNFDQRWTRYLQGVEHIWEKNRPRFVTPAYVIFDPLDEADAIHAKLISENGPSILIPIPRSGHPSSEFLAMTGLMQKLVLDIVNDSLNPAAIISEAMRLRKSTTSYLQYVAHHLKPHHKNWKLSLATRAVDIRRDGWNLAFLAATHAYFGDNEAAVNLLRDAVKLEPNAPRYRVWLYVAKKRLERREALIDDLSEGFISSESAAFTKMIDHY